MEKIFDEEEKKFFDTKTPLRLETDRIIAELWRLRTKYPKATFKKKYFIGIENNSDIVLTEYGIYFNVDKNDFTKNSYEQLLKNRIIYELQTYKTQILFSLEKVAHEEFIIEYVNPEIIRGLVALLKTFE